MRVRMEDGQDRQGAGERESAAAIGVRERRELDQATIERDERARLPRREPEPVAHVVEKGVHPEGATEAEIDDEAEEAPGLKVDPLEGPDRRPQSCIELEWIARIGEEGELLDGFRQRLGDGLPRERLDGWREPRWRERRLRVRRDVAGIAGESFSRDRLGRAPGGKAGAGHAARELDRVPPQAPDPPRAGDTESDSRLPVDRGLLRVGGCATPGSDGRLEPAHRLASRVVEPDGLCLGRGDGNQQPEVAPRQRSVGEGAVDCWQVSDALDDVPEVLQLATRDAQTLACIIVDPNEAELDVATATQERPGEASEDATAERLLADEATEQRVDEVGAEIAVEPTALARSGWPEHVGGNEIANEGHLIHRRWAKNTRNVRWCQLAN